jgi:hypothetical protein
MAAEPAPLPSEEKVRELTADPRLTSDQANQYGDLFLGAGKPAIAMMFYERTRDPARLQQVKKVAVGEGDAFFLSWITRLSPDLVGPDEWREAGERALKDGKPLFARDCFERAGDPDRAQAAREAWLAIFPKPAPPATSAGP